MPLHALAAPCADPRYPALAGAWAVGCGPDGRVDRAVSLDTGALVMLPFASTSPALAPGVVFDLRSGLARLDEGVALLREGVPVVRAAMVAPPSTDGERLALLTRDRVEVGPVDSRTRRSYAARPAEWYPPALAGSWVAWVEDGGEAGEDVLAINTALGGAPVALAAGPGHQRHVVGAGDWLAWVEEGAVTVLDTRSDERAMIPLETGFSAPLALWEGVVCAEIRARGDIDVTCSDGLGAYGPGDQLAPSRFGPWLLYRQEGRTWLRTAP